MRTTVVVVLAVAAMALLLAACGTKEVVVTKEVIQTVVVEKEVPVEKQVVQTVVIEKEVVATPTQAAVMTKEGEGKYGGQLRIVSQASVSTLDGLWTLAYVTHAIALHIYDTPFDRARDQNPKPRMVESWQTSPDGKTWTFTLRSGLRFHDGTPVTADDVVTSLTRWLGGAGAHPSMMRKFVAESAFRKIDGQTFELLLNEPYGGTLAALGNSHPKTYVQPSGIASVPSSEQVTSYIGSGPYKFVKWDQGDRVVLERFEDYVSRDEPSDYLAGGTTAYLDELVWLEIPDEETKIAGLETSEWDLVDGAGLDFYKRLKANADITVPLYKPGHRSNIIVNPNISPFGNLESEAPAGERLTNRAIAGRQALATGMNVESVMASLGPRDLWSLCAAIYYCGTPLESNAGAEYYNRNDKVRARQFLEESGYAGETLTLLNPTDYATITPVGIVVRQEMREIGFNVEMPALDWATVISTLTGKTEGWHTLASWTAHFCCGDPVSDEAAAAGTTWWPTIPEVQRLRVAWAQATDPAEKMRYLDELQIVLYQQVEIVYLGIFYSIFPHTAELKNFEVLGWPYYANTWLER